jgi:hypothetical protein
MEYTFWLPFVVSLAELYLLIRQDRKERARARAATRGESRAAEKRREKHQRLVLVGAFLVLIVLTWTPYFLTMYRTPSPKDPQFKAYATFPTMIGTDTASNEGIVTMVVTIVNDGAPSVAHNWRVFAKQEGEPARDLTILNVPPGRFIDLLGDDNDSVLARFRADQDIRLKLRSDLQRGAAVSGFLSARAPNLRKDWLVRSDLIVTFMDDLDRSHTFITKH